MVPGKADADTATIITLAIMYIPMFRSLEVIINAANINPKSAISQILKKGKYRSSVNLATVVIAGLILLIVKLVTNRGFSKKAARQLSAPLNNSLLVKYQSC